MALLPDPAPRARQHILISVDDHVIEPPDMFDGRLPAALAERAPRIVETEDGRQVWRYEGREYPNIGLNALLDRLADLRLDSSAPTPSVTGVAFRSPAALPVQFTPAAPWR